MSYGMFRVLAGINESREEFYTRFGPKLIEAVVYAMWAEDNNIRTNATPPQAAKSKAYYGAYVTNALETIPDYHAMTNSP